MHVVNMLHADFFITFTLKTEVEDELILCLVVQINNVHMVTVSGGFSGQCFHVFILTSSKWKT